MTFGQLMTLIATEHRPNDQRLGQWYFNLVFEHAPDCANQIRGGPADPFYYDERISDFWTAVGTILGGN